MESFKKLKIGFIILVFCCFAVPSALLLFGFKNANRENRPLAKLPALVEDGKANLDLSSDFDRYMDDNFALREYLVTACNKVSAALLNDYNGDSAIIGRNGTLLYSETADDYIGVNTLSAERISSAAEFLAGLQAQYAESGAKMIFIIAPNKASVYPEFMPSYVYTVEGVRNIDLLQAALAERGVCHIDARGILTDAKREHAVYYLTDSHWNNYGATLVYNAAAELMGLEEYEVSAFTTAEDYRGDLVNFVYPAAEMNEQRLVYTYPRGYEPVDHRVDFDMFRVNETTSDANGICLLMYHDSFGKSLQPIFSPSVGRLVMIKSNSPAYRAEDAVTYGADFVIIELVERNLDLLCKYAAENGY